MSEDMSGSRLWVAPERRRVDGAADLGVGYAGAEPRVELRLAGHAVEHPQEAPPAFFV